MRLPIAKAQSLCYNIPVSNRRWPEGGERLKKLTEKKRRDLEAFEALPPSIREYLLAYAAGMVAGAELKKKATA